MTDFHITFDFDLMSMVWTILSKSGRFSCLLFISEVSRPSHNIWYADASLGTHVSLAYAIWPSHNFRGWMIVPPSAALFYNYIYLNILWGKDLDYQYLVWRYLLGVHVSLSYAIWPWPNIWMNSLNKKTPMCETF